MNKVTLNKKEYAISRIRYAEKLTHADKDKTATLEIKFVGTKATFYVSAGRGHARSIKLLQDLHTSINAQLSTSNTGISLDEIYYALVQSGFRTVQGKEQVKDTESCLVVPFMQRSYKPEEGLFIRIDKRTPLNTIAEYVFVPASTIGITKKPSYPKVSGVNVFEEYAGTLIIEGASEYKPAVILSTDNKAEFEYSIGFLAEMIKNRYVDAIRSGKNILYIEGIQYDMEKGGLVLRFVMLGK